MTQVRRCSIPGCKNQISARSRLGECPACRSYLVSYINASPARVMERRQKIHLFDSRLQVLMPGDPDDLSEKTKMQAPANYKPRSRKGKALLKQSPPSKRAHVTPLREHRQHA